MKTKAEIVQRLLNEGKINAGEAVVLLTSEPKEKEYIVIPQYPSPPYWFDRIGTPANPLMPTFEVTCHLCQPLRLPAKG